MRPNHCDPAPPGAGYGLLRSPARERRDSPIPTIGTMRQRTLWILVAAMGSIVAEPVPAADAPDVVFRRGAPALKGRVEGFQNRALRVAVIVRPDMPPATIAIPVFELQQIVFGERESERRLLTQPTRAPLGELLRIWKEKEPFLAVDNSDAGDFGLAVAGVLLETGNPTEITRALELYQKIYERDWNDRRNALGQQGRLRAMLRLGRAAEAMAEAAELERTSEDPAVLIEAKYVLAEASLQDFKKLLKNNPRWQEDEFVRPEHDRLYHATLDLLLYPYLFHGSEEAQAARGLSRAIEMLTLSGEIPKALELARDLVVLYPATTQADAARDFLNSQPKTKSHEKSPS